MLIVAGVALQIIGVLVTGVDRSYPRILPRPRTKSTIRTITTMMMMVCVLMGRTACC